MDSCCEYLIGPQLDLPLRIHHLHAQMLCFRKIQVQSLRPGIPLQLHAMGERRGNHGGSHIGSRITVTIGDAEDARFARRQFQRAGIGNKVAERLSVFLHAVYCQAVPRKKPPIYNTS